MEEAISFVTRVNCNKLSTGSIFHEQKKKIKRQEFVHFYLQLFNKISRRLILCTLHSSSDPNNKFPPVGQFVAGFGESNFRLRTFGHRGAFTC